MAAYIARRALPPEMMRPHGHSRPGGRDAGDEPTPLLDFEASEFGRLFSASAADLAIMKSLGFGIARRERGNHELGV